MTAPVVFLPGIVAPASVRYRPLLEQLGGIEATLKDLEVYAGPAVSERYTVQAEVDGLRAAVDATGRERVHVYGHSGGGAVALAFAVQHPDRLLSLALDEPAHDFTPAGNDEMGWQEYDAAATLPPAEAVQVFLLLQVAPGVKIAPPPDGDPPPWMASRPAGIDLFRRAIREHTVEPEAYRDVTCPVLFTRGSRSHPRWELMHERLGGLFPRFRSEVFEGLHHMNTSHQADPERVAQLLRELWRDAERAS